MALHLAAVLLVDVHTQSMIHAPGRCVPQIIAFLNQYLPADHYSTLLRTQGTAVLRMSAVLLSAQVQHVDSWCCQLVGHQGCTEWIFKNFGSVSVYFLKKKLSFISESRHILRRSPRPEIGRVGAGRTSRIAGTYGIRSQGNKRSTFGVRRSKIKVIQCQNKMQKFLLARRLENYPTNFNQTPQAHITVTAVCVVTSQMQKVT